MDEHQLRQAFDEVFDQAVVFHGFADYMRDYDIYVYATADPRTGVAPAHLRYRFTNCVRATVTSAVRRDVSARSLDDALTDYDTWLGSGAPEGYVWGVKWQCLFPGMNLLPETDETREWSAQLGRPLHEAMQGQTTDEATDQKLDQNDWRDLGLPGYVGGLFADWLGGLITFEADSFEHAEGIIAADPFVQEQLLETSVVKQWMPE